jgi:hypothetical protein
MRSVRLLGVWGAIVSVACGGGAPASDSDEQRAVNVTLDAIQVLSTPEVVARVVDLQPTPDGRVWVLNSLAPYFVVVGPDGRIERQFGEQGGGPEEFGLPMSLVRGAESDVWTYDVRRNALIRVAGGERREIALARDSIPVPSIVSFQGAGVVPAAPWLESLGDGFLMARSRVMREESALHVWNADIIAVRGDERIVSVDLHTPIADLLGDPSSRYPGATFMLPYPMWTVCADGIVALYDPLANSMRRFTEERAELEPIALPVERRQAVTPDLLFEMFYRRFVEDQPSVQIPPQEEMRRLTEEQNRQMASSSAPFFPEYTDLICTPNAFWLRRFDSRIGRLGQGPEWLRIAKDGSQTSVALPNTFRAFRIDSDRIWGTVSDSLDVASIAWVEMDALR